MSEQIPLPDSFAEDLMEATEKQLASMRVLCVMADQEEALQAIDQEARRRGLI
jgi:hypothetical protein